MAAKTLQQSDTVRPCNSAVRQPERVAGMGKVPR